MRNDVHCQWKAWLIWLIAASFYAFEFFLRISPEVMVPDLLRQFVIDAVMVSNLSAVYYYAYATMQLPAGFLLDRFGIRPLLTIAAVLVAAGSVLFASTHIFIVAIVGRILMGVGSAFSFIGCLKLARNWFPERQFAVIVGLTNTLGVVGALWGEGPLAAMVNHWGWRQTLWLAGLLGAIVAILIRTIVRDNPKMLGCRSPAVSTTKVVSEKQHFWQALKGMLGSRRTWLTACYGGCMVAPISAFTELWSVPFFIQTAHLARVTAAELSSLVFIGIAIGGPVNAWISGKLRRRKPVMFLGALSALFCFLWIIYFPHVSWLELAAILFCFGFFTSSMLLAFAINSENNDPAISGMVIGFTNMLVMLGGTLFQPLVGFLLDKQQTHFTGYFSLFQYQHAFLVLAFCQVLAFFLLFFIKETYCQGQCSH